MLDDWGSHAVAGMIRLQARARVAGASTRGHSVLSDERVVVQVASRAPPAHGGVWIKMDLGIRTTRVSAHWALSRAMGV